ncbi:MAG: hypothetical protein N2Z22_03450 [Turneriella sp.]|nr:hypothetical protein [Turneriella sp.]
MRTTMLFFTVLFFSRTFAQEPVKYEQHIPPLALRKTIQAGILLLEARAYEQFIRVFLSEKDFRKFAENYERPGGVDYARWAAEKSEKVLTLLRSLEASEAVNEGMRVCFYRRGENAPLISFYQERGMWLIENKSRCQPRKAIAPNPDDNKN